MQSALRLLRLKPRPTVFSSPLPLDFGRRICGARFQQVVAGNNLPETGGDSSSMDKSSQTQKKSGRGETMSSFGEGYSTRSDEEGFGGIYGRNQEVAEEEEENIGHSEAPEFDTGQGCEVKEKERSRHQKDHASWQRE